MYIFFLEIFLNLCIPSFFTREKNKKKRKRKKTPKYDNIGHNILGNISLTNQLTSSSHLKEPA